MNTSFFNQAKEIPANVANLFPSQNRAVQFYASRRALHQCLEKELAQELVFDIPSLEIINHSHLKNYPEIVVSISHTKSLGAALCASKKEYLSVGIDIEIKSRPIKKGILKFYTHSEDDPRLDPLEIWAIKEACFKAISPLIPQYEHLFEGKLTLSKIWVKNNQFGIEKQAIGEFQTKEETFESYELIVALAFIMAE